MSLLDRFRPDWKNSDAETRADAVRALGPSAVETLTELARTDPDAKVQSLAIRKLEDPDLLLELSKELDDASLKELAHERAASLLIDVANGSDEGRAQAALDRLSRPVSLGKVAQGAELEDIRNQALGRIQDDETRLSVIEHSEDLELRKKALEALEEQASLLKVAIHEMHGALAEAALRRLESSKDWREVASKAQVKAVRQAAQAKLDAMAEDKPATGSPKSEEVSQDVSQETSQEDTQESSEEQAQEETAAAPPAQPAQSAQAPSADAAPEAPPEEPGSASATGEKATVGAAADLTPWVALCETVEGLQASDPEAKLAEARKAFDALGTLPEGGAEVVQRFSKAVAAAEERIGLHESAEETRVQQEELCAEAEAAIAEEDLQKAVVAWRDVQRRWHGLEATVPELKERFTTAAKALQERLGEQEKEQAQEARNNLSRLTGLAERLEAMAQAEEIPLRKAERALRDSHAALQNHGPLPSSKDWPPIKKRLDAAREALTPKVRQLEQEEEWKRWANVPLQEALIERMEALIETKDLAHASRELRVCSEEWKQVASAPREKSEELWQKFRTAREKVRERVKVFQQEQDKQRKENLKLKLELCEKAEALGDSTEWRKTAEALKVLQREWKKIGPVPRKQSDQVWKRFRKPCDNFFGRRKEHFAALDAERQENLKKKEALVEQAEALSESNDWAGTTNKFKSLQAEWKNVGPVPRKVSDAIWSRFRKAADTFFDRRSRKDELPLEDNLKEKQAAIAELKALLPEPPKAKKPAKGKKKAKAEETKAEEPKAEVVNAEEEAAKADDAKPVTEKPAAGDAEAKDTEPKEADTEEPKAEEASEADAAEAKTEPAEELKADEPKAEEPKAEEPKAEEAAAEPETEEPSGPPEDLADRIQAARQAFRDAGQVPRKRQREIEQRFTEVCNRLIAAYPDHLEGTELDPKVLAEKRTSIVDRAQKILADVKEELKALDEAGEPSIQDLAAQLKEALAANTIRRGAESVDASRKLWNSAKASLGGLRQRWEDLPGEADPSVAKRFEKVFKDFMALEPKKS